MGDLTGAKGMTGAGVVGSVVKAVVVVVVDEVVVVSDNVITSPDNDVSVTPLSLVLQQTVK